MNLPTATDRIAGAPASGPVADDVEYLVHNKVRLALHHLRRGAGRPLLLLHGLGESAATSVPEWAAGWPGAVAALDFTGHGRSTVPPGGGYSAEIMLADADMALDALAGDSGKLTVVGRGLGAYVALMLAVPGPTRSTAPCCATASG